MTLSTSYETDLKAFEENFKATKPDFNAEHASLYEDISTGVREGIRRAGMSSSTVRLIDDASVENGDGTITAGVFNRATHQIGLAGVERLAETIDSSVPDVQVAVRNQVEATLNHEQRHQDSCENAKARGEFGLISSYLGAEADRLFQELMASKGTEAFDAYDADRAKALALASKIGLSGAEVIRLVYEGREAEVVMAAFESGYLTSQNAELN
ncbi:MAG: hypothetical protein AB7J40_03625 [Candidatus Altimarinota bacterium]